MLNFKNSPRWVLALVMVLFALAAPASEMVSVSRSEVNMRSGASAQSPVLWALGQGYPLKVMARKGRWLKVRDFENDLGWVYRPMVAKTPHMIVKVGVANIRSTPGTRGRILAKAQYGDLLRTLEHRNEWVRVQREGGLKGWVSRSLVWGW